MTACLPDRIARATPSAPNGLAGEVEAEPTFRVLALVGSLRANSFNRRLAAACAELLPDGAELTIFPSLGEIPLYDEELDTDPPPSPVRALREALVNADALLVVTPEYNYGVPGLLKNALDWASRPVAASPLRGLPTGIVGASPGTVGSARAHAQLRELFAVTRTPVLPHPDVLVPFVQQRFDGERFTDEPLRALLRQYLAELEAWARLIAPRRAVRAR